MVQLQLDTPRLRLRPPCADDLRQLLALFGDADVMRYVASGRPFETDETAAMLTRMIDRFRVDGFGQFIVERLDSDSFVGRIGLLPLDPCTWQSGSRRELGPDAEIEIGWTLAPEAWGHGFALEGARAIRDWAREELDLRRLVSIIQVGNVRSVQLAHRLGARRERAITTSFGKPAELFGYVLE
jgi:RimJ/RimL family protein N-acetyltransferase